MFSYFCCVVLSGIVNKKTSGFVGCLVHGLFNVSLPRPYHVAVQAWVGSSAKLHDTVKFVLRKIDLQTRIPHFEGEICEIRYECLL